MDVFDYFPTIESMLEVFDCLPNFSRQDFFAEVREFFDYDDNHDITYDDIVEFARVDSFYAETLFSEYESIFPQEEDCKSNSDLRFDNMDKEELYINKLGFETELSVPSIFAVVDTDYISNRQKWLAEINSLIDETDFQNWKDKYISEQLAKYKQENKKILVCEYSFIGNGNFVEYVSEDYFPWFEQFIAKNITASCKKPVIADDEQAKIFLGLNALQEYYEVSRYEY